MEIRANINAKLKEAMKSKDQVAISTIRLIMAAMKDRDITSRGSGKAEGIEENEILSMLQTMVKQRLESAKTYDSADRKDLADRERAEIVVIQSFMPKQLSDDEIKQAVSQKIKELNADSIKDMGKIMGALKQDYAGQMDMARAGAIVREKLN